MKGYITEKQEFLFPDSPLGELPASISTAMARNGSAGVELLLESRGKVLELEAITGDFQVEYYEMLDIPVEYNTGNGVDQGGAMVILPEACPDYAIRRAPFRVYDCLRPAPDGRISAGERAAAYVCLRPKDRTPAGIYTVPLRLRAGEEEQVCRITCRVYPVAIEEERFRQTNWFSLEAIARVHGAQPGSDRYYELVRKYARAMRRIHQKIFCIWINEDYFRRPVTSPDGFCFDELKPVIEIFFEEGFNTLETGGILSRGYLPDGSRDMYTGDFKCSANPGVSVDSDRGYALLSGEMRAFSEFLRKNHWQDRVLFHIMDEPDVHYLRQEDLEARRVQYFMAANLVRRYLPGVRIIEAVKTTRFRGAVDIMVPITDGYQSNQAAFDQAIALGDEVWTYVCCGPEGKWLNRFLDQPLANGRLLFWGCEANRISGYLHWGFNQFGCTPDPFRETRGRNDCGIGTDFPCGDAFLVYPGEDGPWLSLRLEAAGKGAEEACLLQQLRDRDPEKHDAVIGQVFRAFDDYENSPDRLTAASEQLLAALSETIL